MKNYYAVLEQLKLKTRSEIKHALYKNNPETEINCQSFFLSLTDELKLNLDEKESNFLFHQIDPYSKGFIKYETLENYLEIYEEKSYQIDEDPFHKHPTLHHGVRCQDNIFEWEEYIDSGDDLSDHYASLSRGGFLTFWRKDMTKHFETTIAVLEEGAKMNTMATGFACMPRYKIVAASSTTSDIRFFHTNSYKFKHAFSIVWLPSIILNMHCHDSEVLVCGDFTGQVYLIRMEPSFFQRIQKRAEHLEPEKIHFDNILKGRVQGLRYEAARKIHFSTVEKVRYIPSLRAVISCSLNAKRAMLIYSLDKKKSLSFHSEGGVSSFAFSERLSLVVTGGIDNLVKIWNPKENSACSDTLAGHMSSLTHVLVDDKRLHVITADRERNMRVWDLLHPVCLQTIKFKEPELTAKSAFSNIYLNESLGKLIVTTYLAAVLDARETPVRLHAHPDSELILLAAYSDIFDCLVTVGNRSSVAVWCLDECTLINEFSDAYTVTSEEGISRVLDITAAGLDPTKRRLVTAGHKGCIKVWNFLLGICLRQFQAPFSVLSLSFVGFEIFAGGSGGLVSVFYDNGEVTVDPVHWEETPHKRSVVSMDCYGQAFLGSGSSDGEIVFWLWKNSDPKLTMRDSSDAGNEEEEEETHDYPAKSLVSQRRRCSISQLLFLRSREMDEIVGNLVSCGLDGRVRFWNVLCTSKRNQCRLLSKFRAVFREGDGVICMATDSKNKILFTGDTMGYLRMYDLDGYYSTYGSAPSQTPQAHLLRKYPFLSLQRQIGAKHSKFGSSAELGCAPLLLNCFRAHLGALHRVEFSDARCVVATATRPGTVRLWTLSGDYLGFLGSHGSFRNPLDRKALKEQVPDDIRKVASMVTLHVLNGGKKPLWKRAMNAFKRCRLGCEPGGSETLPFDWMKTDVHKISDSIESFSLQKELEKRISLLKKDRL